MGKLNAPYNPWDFFGNSCPLTYYFPGSYMMQPVSHYALIELQVKLITIIIHQIHYAPSHV